MSAVQEQAPSRRQFEASAFKEEENPHFRELKKVIVDLPEDRQTVILAVVERLKMDLYKAQRRVGELHLAMLDQAALLAALNKERSKG